MFIRRLEIVVALLLFAAMPMYVGCSDDALAQGGTERTACEQPKKKACGFCDKLAGKCPKPECPQAQNPCCPQPQVKNACAQDLPPDAVEGECYAKVFVPPEYKTVTERDLVKEASERIEITPAEYKWVEERIMTKEASKQLVEIPATYKWEEKSVCVKPAYKGWVMEKKTRCAGDSKPRDVFCLVSTPAEFKTIRTQVMATPACVREEIIPAQYDTVRRQIVATPPTTRKVCIPAEYAEHERTVLVAEGCIKWEHIVCEHKVTSDAANKIKTALTAAGYVPGPLDGKLAAADWAALTQFQQKNRLGVGELSYETLEKLGVSIE